MRPILGFVEGMRHGAPARAAARLQEAFLDLALAALAFLQEHAMRSCGMLV